MASFVERTRRARSRLLASLTVAALCGRAEGAAPVPRPAKLLPAIQVIAAEPVRVVWPAAGRAVNAPPTRATVVPGQRIALVALAEGAGRDALLQGATFTYRVRAAGAETVVGPQRADAVKAIKAEGADFVVQVVGAAGLAVADRNEIEEAVTSVSLAAVLPSWTAPEVKARLEVTVEGAATLASGEKIPLAPARFAVETWAVAAAKTPFRDAGSLQKWMNGYALSPEPQHLGAVLRIAAASGAHPLAVLGFPARALQVAPPAAATAVIAALKGEDERARALGAVALRWAHADASALLATLSEEWKARVEGFPPLPEGYELDAAVDSLDATTRKMDLLWCELMATGRPEPVRAIADLLRFRDDDRALTEAAKTPARMKELTPELARGVLYRTAGWSLSSFTRTSPIVADYVARWREDEAVPVVVREELRRLLVNDAFRPKEAK